MEIKKLIENMDELCDLAELAKCEVSLPSSEVRGEIKRLAVGLPSAGGGMGTGMICAPPGLIVTAISFALKASAERKAKEALLPVYKELAVKVQALNIQQANALLEQQALLDKEIQKGKDNSRKIEELSKKLELQGEIIARFERLQNA